MPANLPKTDNALRLVKSAVMSNEPREIDDEPFVEKVTGWRWFLYVGAFTIFAYACAIAAGYVLVMLLRLVANAA